MRGTGPRLQDLRDAHAKFVGLCRPSAQDTGTSPDVVLCAKSILTGMSTYSRAHIESYLNNQVSESEHKDLWNAFREFLEFLSNLQWFVAFWAGDKAQKASSDLANLEVMRTRIQADLEVYADYWEMLEDLSQNLDLRSKYHVLRINTGKSLREFARGLKDLADAV